MVDYLYPVQVYFKETQKFALWWVWLILVPLVAIMGYSWWADDGTTSYLWVAISTTIVVVTITVLFVIMRLTTVVTADSITVHFFPLVRRKFLWQEVKKVNVIDYGFIGGWGIRLWTGYGTAYNMSGSKGLHIKLISGKEYLVGTQRPEELDEVVNKIFANGSYNR